MEITTSLHPVGNAAAATLIGGTWGRSAAGLFIALSRPHTRHHRGYDRMGVSVCNGRIWNKEEAPLQDLPGVAFCGLSV
jgi:hypothetical protein